MSPSGLRTADAVAAQAMSSIADVDHTSDWSLADYTGCNSEILVMVPDTADSEVAADGLAELQATQVFDEDCEDCQD